MCSSWPGNELFGASDVQKELKTLSKQNANTEIEEA